MAAGLAADPPLPARARREDRQGRHHLATSRPARSTSSPSATAPASAARSRFANADVDRQRVDHRPVEIGDDVTIGSSCVLGPTPRSSRWRRNRRPDRDPATARSSARPRTWDGSPGRKVGDGRRRRPADAGRRAGVAPARGCRPASTPCCYVIVPPLGLLPIFPAFYIFDQLDDALSATARGRLRRRTCRCWPGRPRWLMIAGTVLLIAAVRWMVLPTRAAGRAIRSISWFYVRKWMRRRSPPKSRSKPSPRSSPPSTCAAGTA